MLQKPFVVPNGFLVVDLFFVLSGFVIALSYEAKFADHLTLGQFFIIRFIRLYPLYILGTMLATLLLFSSLILHGQMAGLNARVVHAVPFALAMLPNLDVSNPYAELYPLNPPAWSLLFEILANLAYAATWRCWCNRNIVIDMALIAILLLSGSDFYSDGGWNRATVHLGILGVLYTFASGVLIFRLTIVHQFEVQKFDSLVVLAVLPLLLLLPSAVVMPFCGPIGWPLLVLLATASEPSGGVSRLCAMLGGASYAFYAIRCPLIEVLNAAFARLGFVSGSSGLIGIAFIAILVPACVFLDRVFDQPSRIFLSRMSVRRARRLPI